jgi:signal transduction histidine kinase/FixJ family two-component response regulator
MDPTPPVAADTVLLVDDDALLLRTMKGVLETAGLKTFTAGSAEEALEVLQRQVVQVVLSDGKMPGMGGVELLRRVRAGSPAIQRLLLTGVTDPRAAEDAINDAGVFRFLLKPCDRARLVETVRAACEQYDLQEQRRYLAALAERQNEELAKHAATLEAKVLERTRLLSQAKTDWERTFDAIDRPIAVIESNYGVVRANKAYARLADRPLPALAGLPCHTLLFKRDAPCAECKLARSDASESFELAGPRSFAVNTYRAQERYVCIYRETTQEREQLRQMVQTEKFAAVGMLAGGVAHEINNPLGAVLAFTQLMLREAGRSDDDLETLRDIEHATLRCKRIVESLLRFSRRQALARKTIDLNKAVEDASVLFGAQLRCAPKAQLVTRMSPTSLAVLGDANEIEQVVLNLLMNALQALPETGGTVTLSTQDAGDAVEVSVQDTGPGIPAEHRSKIFNLGFTTKPPGEGTGFGLAISWSIAQAHGGRIDFESEPGRGTTFTLRLPSAAALTGSKTDKDHP